ncbi:hypothetical protein SSPIM334S_07214 [Streptomyces spiroverticillatus]
MPVKGPRSPVLGGAGREVGVVVLDGDTGEGQGVRPLGGEVAGVQVVGDGRGVIPVSRVRSA